jgi:menaquinol-cytochrome c reductase iron-sulfur subunit
MTEGTQNKKLDRRGFIGTLTWAIGTLIAAGFTIPALAYIVGPALQEEESEEWIRLGSISKVELGTPTLFKARVERKTGWIVNEEEISVYLLTDNGRDFIAMSNICTHLGCRVRWINEQDRFFCPCHNGIFDKQGQIVSGPIPRPLDQYEVMIEDGQLFMRGA